MVLGNAPFNLIFLVSSLFYNCFHLSLFKIGNLNINGGREEKKEF